MEIPLNADSNKNKERPPLNNPSQEYLPEISWKITGNKLEIKGK